MKGDPLPLKHLSCGSWVADPQIRHQGCVWSWRWTRPWVPAPIRSITRLRARLRRPQPHHCRLGVCCRPPQGRVGRDRENRKDREAAGGREHQPGRVVRVPTDAELPTVVGIVVEGAQRHQVVHVRAPAGGPVPDVVDLQVRGGGAPRKPAAAIPVQHQPPCALGHDPQRSSDADRHPRALPQRLHRPLTRELPHQMVRKPRSAVQPSAVGIEVDVDPEGVPTAGRRHPCERALADLDQRVRPRHLWHTGREEGVLGLGHRRLDQRPGIRRRREPKLEAPLAGGHRQLRRGGRPTHIVQRRLSRGSARLRRRLRVGTGPHRRLGVRLPGRRVERVARQHPGELRDAGRNGQLGHRCLHVRRCVPGHHRDLVHRQKA